MWIAIPLTAFFAAVICHAVTRRVFPRTPGVAGFTLWSFVWGIAALLGAQAANGLTPATIVGLLVYLLGCELYVFAFTVASHSVSAMVLAKLRQGPCRAEDLEVLCSHDLMVQKRKTQMLKTGLLAGVRSDIRITDKGKRLLNAFDGFRRFFFPPLGASE